MGLRTRLGARLGAYGVARAHVLLVEVPGWWRTRVAVEQACLARGWPVALSPADADVLLVCGRPGDRLAAAVDQVWDQLPGPRTRSQLLSAHASVDALEQAAAQLLDEAQQRQDAGTRSRQWSPPATGPDHGDMDHGDMDHGDMDRGDMDRGDMEIAPGGITLAEGGEDRDGLEMDVLHVPLGPVLPCWPAGLVLRCSLQGDVVTEAELEVLEAAAPGPAQPLTERISAARRCDGASRLLTLAGWGDAAAAARGVRDALLSDRPGEAAAVQLARLRERAARSRSLRWSLHGLAALDAATLREYGLPDSAGGDVRDRLLRLLVPLEEGSPAPAPGPQLAALPALVTGLDLAAARLVVASLDPDTAVLTREPAHA